MTQNLEGLNYEVCSTNIAKISGTQIIYFSFWYMRHYTPAACCHDGKIYEIRLYVVWQGCVAGGFKPLPLKTHKNGQI